MTQSSETRKVTIEIITTENGIPNPIKPEPKDEEGKIKRGEFDKLESVLINQAYNQAKSVVKQAVNTTLNMYYNMKEDYMFENNVNQIKTIVGKVSSLAISVYGGFKVGNVGGALISGAGWLINEGISQGTRIRDLYSQINSSNYDKAFTRQRVGLTDNGRGTEN